MSPRDTGPGAISPLMSSMTVNRDSLTLLAQPSNAKFSAFTAASSHAVGLKDCFDAWERIRCITSPLFLNIRTLNDDPAVIATLSVAKESLGLEVPLSAVAGEVVYALENGVRSTTALACILLASIAQDLFDGGDEAINLAKVALNLATQSAQDDLVCIQIIYTTMIKSHAVGLDHAASLLRPTPIDQSLPLQVQLHLSSRSFVAGISLPELAHQLEAVENYRRSRQLCHSSKSELALRRRLYHSLSCADVGVNYSALNEIGDRDNVSFGCWLLYLQICWFAGDYQNAQSASKRGAELISQSTPVADVICYHLFSVLTYGRLAAPNLNEQIAAHSFELSRLACASSISISVISELASATRNRCAGKTLVALSGLEQVSEKATRLGQHWISGLAAEEAAQVASQAHLHSAVGHYRQQALMSYKRWGALGRVDQLDREWSEKSGMEKLPNGSQRLHTSKNSAEVELYIAHEVNQPLAAITLQSAAARKWLRRSEPNVERALASLELISEAVRHAGDIVRVVKRFASDQENEMELVDVDQAISDVVRILDTNLKKQGIKAEVTLDLNKTAIYANRVQLQQVVTNLLVNSIEACSEVQERSVVKCIRVSSHMINANEIEIVVEDNGPGIELECRDRIFKSLFTTKSGNSGLGLSISSAIIRKHRGTIEFEPCEPQGARFRVRLPIQRPQ
jgi:signal transduction histidine kinase